MTNNYSEMSTDDLEELKESLLSQRDNLDNNIEEVIKEIKTKRLQTNEMSLKLNPYYKDKVTYLKVIINDNSYFKYTITKVTPSGKSVGIYQFSSDNIDFLRYYKMCAKSEWDSAIDRLNVWLIDANLKVEEL
nr:MAG TPA: hypothetical protein [Crassvirales sp.]